MNPSRNITVCVKVNEREYSMLLALVKGASAGKGLRYLIDKYLHRSDTT